MTIQIHKCILILNKILTNGCSADVFNAVLTDSHFGGLTLEFC